MSATIDIDYSRFNAGIDELIRKAGINSKVVVEKETGELIKTLVKISPPKDVARTKYNIETSVRSKFGWAADQQGRTFEETSGGIGPSGIKWYSVDEKFLRGVLPQNDMRDNTPEAVYKVYQRTTKKGRLNLPFRFPRKRQRVLISSKLLVSQKQIRTVVKRIQSHVGRLKAGWMVAIRDGVIKLTGGQFTPPKQVMQNLNSGTRGRFENGLSTPSNPNFTIVNFAKGATSSSMRYFLQAALTVRGKAMATNLKLFLIGKKNIGDYAGNASNQFTKN